MSSSYISGLLQRRSLRSVLLVPFVLVVLGVSGLLGWLWFQSGRDAVSTLAGRLNADILLRIDQEMQANIEQAEVVARTFASSVASDSMAPEDVPALERQLWRTTRVSPAAAYAFIGFYSGDFIGVERTHELGERAFIRERNAGTNGELRTYVASKPGERVNRNIDQTATYDASKRGWFMLANQRSAAVWTPVYLSASKRVLVVTHAIPLIDSLGAKQGVLGIDIRLSQLSEFMRRLEISKNGVAFVVEPSGDLIATSADELPYRRVGNAEVRLAAKDSANALVRDTAARLNVQPAKESNRIAQLTYSSSLGPVNVATKPFVTQEGLNWTLVVATPQADFTGAITQNATHTAVVAAVAVLLMLALGLAVLRWITSDLDRIAKAAASLHDGREHEEVTLPTDRADEVGDLARAFSRMQGRLRDSMATIQLQNTTLQRVNLALEERVFERTEALKRQNDDLAREIKSRTEAEYHVRKLSKIVEQADDGILMCDEHERVEYCNPAFERVTGWQLAEIVGKRPGDFLKSAHHGPEFHAEMNRVYRSGRVFRGVIVNRRRDGAHYYSEKSISPVRGSNGLVRGYVSVERDVSARERESHTMRIKSRLDVLTGLFNRDAFAEEFARLQAHARRSNDEGAAIMFIDLDGFKRVNDEFNHQIGDLVLTEVGRRLVSAVREEDIVARWGGDEFVALFPGVADEAGARVVAEKLLAAITPPIAAEGRCVEVGASIGIAFAAGRAHTLDALVRSADEAMYAAKRAGRGQFVFAGSEATADISG